MHGNTSRDSGGVNCNQKFPRYLPRKCYTGNTVYFMVKLRNNVPRLYWGWDKEKETIW